MRYRPACDERGTVVILVAAAMVAIVTVVALVIDIGAVRAERRSARSLTDVTARAGVGYLQYGPWAGVCQARTYLLGNARRFSQFDTGSEHWSNAAATPTTYVSNPCTNTSVPPYTNVCLANAPATWAKLTATALNGDITIEIQSGYTLPDPRFAEDTVIGADTGDVTKGSCDNLAVIVKQRQSPMFAGVVGAPRKTTTVRSVGRLQSVTDYDYLAALLLLEQHKCNVLQTGGTNTRVIAQPYESHPGVIQIDSADDDTSGNCAQPILNGQATQGGPSIVACSARTSNPSTGCNVATGNTSSRIGIYAMNFNRPAGHIATAYPTTYGDTKTVPGPISGRRNIDTAYRGNLASLESTARNVLTGNVSGSAASPPGCTSIVNHVCTGNGLTWLVLRGTDCSTQLLPTFTASLLTAPNVWFDCDLNVSTPITIGALNSYVVVTGRLDVSNVFAIADPRTIYIGGQSTGSATGLAVSGTTSLFTVNLASAANCLARAGLGKTTTMVIAAGAMKLSSSSTTRLCQTFVYMGNNYNKLPATNGTPPCDCTTYKGTLDISSNAFVDWSAPNQINGRRPTADDLLTKKYEDLAFWTEAGGNSNTVTGGGTTSMAGIYFLGNADSFNLAGGGSLPVYFSAQFISRTMKVTGGATVNLVPNPNDSIAVNVYTILLVR